VNVVILKEIKKILKEKAQVKAKASWQKFVPTAKRIHGVYLVEINKMVTSYKKGGFKLVEDLWHSGYLEERLLASKILGKIASKDFKLTLKLIKKFVKDVDDWAVCDTLAT